MAIITISRELAALGDETAKEIEKRTNFRFIDKVMLEEKIKSAGLSDAHLEKYDEKKPSFFDSISEERDVYLNYLRQAVLNEALDGDCIFMGRGASCILRGVPGVLSVYLSSSMSARIARVKSYFRCDDKQARLIIEHSDVNRAGFYKYFFETEWRSPDNYIISLNTSRIAPSVCADTVAALSRSIFNPETDEAARIKLNDMSLSCSVVNHILYQKNIPVHFLNAFVKEDRVVLYGVASSACIVEAAKAAALEVKNFTEVKSDIQIVQEYPLIPRMS